MKIFRVSYWRDKMSKLGKFVCGTFLAMALSVCLTPAIVKAEAGFTEIEDNIF